VASLDDRFTTVDGTVHLTGIQSLVRVLVDQRRADARHGLDIAGFVSGYPGSPLGTLDLELARRYAYENGLDRIVARGGPGDHAWLGIIAAGRPTTTCARRSPTWASTTPPWPTTASGSCSRPCCSRSNPGGWSSWPPGSTRSSWSRTSDRTSRPSSRTPSTAAPAPRVVGKTDDAGRPLLPGHGELNPDLIARALPGGSPPG
jgi:hypothetical protein